MTDTDRNATRRFNRYVNKRRRLAAAHVAGDHADRTVRDCPGCEGHDAAAALAPPQFDTNSN